MFAFSSNSDVEQATGLVCPAGDGVVVKPDDRVQRGKVSDRPTAGLEALRPRPAIDIDEPGLVEGRQYPRWAVLVGVLAYCVVAWAVVFQLGGVATEAIASLIENGNAQQAAASTSTITR